MSDASSNRPDRAVIDIGSNTVRLVVYAGPPRVPRAWLNESVKARLGRDLASTGRLPARAVRQALDALARYATILDDLGITDVLTVATAAVRDAANGAEFLREVSGLGLAPRLLSGEEEAKGSAFGVLGAFPGARGTVADLGGGSLELVEVADGACRHGVSLQLGTLRLPALRESGSGRLEPAVRRLLRAAEWTADHPGTLYLVGGTWRAFASYAIHAERYPLGDPHALRLDAAQVQRLASQIVRMAPGDFEAIPGISSTRAAALPDAAALMQALHAQLRPSEVIVSAWGLREGLLVRRLSPRARAQDPLPVEVADFAEPRGGPALLAKAIADWAAAVPSGGLGEARARLRMAAAQLALAASHLEPNLRRRHAYEWAMDKRWAGLDPAGRGWVAAALLASTGKAAAPAELERLVDRASLQEAAGWGLAVRLASRLAAGSEATLRASRLSPRAGTLVLSVAPERSHLVSAKVSSDLRNLARWHRMEPAIEGQTAAVAGRGEHL